MLMNTTNTKYANGENFRRILHALTTKHYEPKIFQTKAISAQVLNCLDTSDLHLWVQLVNF